MNRDSDAKTKQKVLEGVTDLDEEHSEPDQGSVMLKAPDGGWGWVVCFGCFMMTVLNDGVGFSFGVVFVELLDYYKGTKAETVWIFSLSCCSCFLTGPIVAALVSKFGCRTVAAVGSVVTFSSYLISAFTPNLHFLYFSLGILQGLGDGMHYLPTIIIVSEYFEKRRAFATGLTVCGAGIGTFVFSPLTVVLIETYAWRGAVLVQAGVVLNCLACSLLYRPLQPMMTREQNKQLLDDVDKDNASDEECNNRAKSQSVCKWDGKASDTDINEEVDNKEYAETHSQVLNTHDIKKKGVGANCCKEREDGISDGALVYETTAQTCAANDKSIFRAVCNSFKDSFSLELFKNRTFAFYTFAMLIYHTGYYIPFIYLPVKSENVGIGELKAAWILSTLGISSTVGRIFFGYISDKKWVNRLYLYSVCLLLCGVASCLVPLFTSFTCLLLYAVVFGIFSGATVPLTWVLITDIVGKENQTSAFGISNFAVGISTLTGPPLAGWIYDISGSYNGSFLLAGITITVTGVMLFAIPCMDKQWHRHQHPVV